MIKKDKIQKLIKPFICSLCLLLTGCSAIGLAQESTFDSAYENVEEEVPVDIFTSSAAVLIESINLDEQTITLYMTDSNKSRTFYYDNVTSVQDKYGSAMSMTQLAAGEIADITYNSELEKVGSISLSADAWSQDSVTKYNLTAGNGSVTIGDEIYSLDANVKVFSEGQAIAIEQVISQDVLNFRGKGHTIMSISVDKGHGYLDLVNDEALLGGWIEIGQAVISQIAPDMLLTVPEGSYTVRMTAQGIEETRDIVIERNKEAVIDLSNIEVPKPENGRVIFEISPANATVYVDNEKIDTSAYVIRLPFGLHQVTAQASGYDTLTEYVQVEGETTSIKMELQEQSTVSGNDITNQKENSTVTVDTPIGAEVYQDNLYMEIAPVTYFKTAGSHTITLRRSGYITRSYAVQIADDDKDVTYSFAELDPENGQNTVSGNSTEVSKNTVSGNESTQNTVSGNTVSGNSNN